MSVDPRTPVLVGVGAVSQREDDPATAAEPLELMARALEAAADDAGSAELLQRLDAIAAPRGFWDYGDPGRLLAERFGAGKVHTTVAEVGVLQSTLLGEAAQRIADGEADVVAVTGAEAKYRSLRAKILGVEDTRTEQNDVEADRVLRPLSEIYTEIEIQLGLVMPVNQYAVLENALRFEQGLSIDAHRREVAEMWAAMSRVAAANPDAWSRETCDADTIREVSDRNRMLAFPYTKLHNSNWNVDQAAGLLFCSVGVARSMGIPESRWVFPLAIADSNHMVPLSRRAELARCPGARITGARALEHSGAKVDDVAHVEIYSCFPSAVRIQARELGIAPGRQITVTGGMAFAGGPLNNFVLQSVARMAQQLRADRGSLGLVTAVSGILTKQGTSCWSSEAGSERFRFEDVSDATNEATRTLELEAEAAGAATVAGYTVMYEWQAPKVVALCDTPTGTRALAASVDPDIIRIATEEELVGRTVRVDGQLLSLSG